MDSSNLLSQIEHELQKQPLISSNGDEYKFSSSDSVEATLFDSRAQFNVYIEGKTSGELHRSLINQAVVLTWNLTAYQTKNFVKYFLNGYQFTFVPSSSLLVSSDGRLHTKLTYFVSDATGRLATADDFELLPKLEWLQDSFIKYDLPYVVLGVSFTSRQLRDYEKLYFVDFGAYIDPSWEEDIGETILANFRRIYLG